MKYKSLLLAVVLGLVYIDAHATYPGPGIKVEMSWAFIRAVILLLIILGWFFLYGKRTQKKHIKKISIQLIKWLIAIALIHTLALYLAHSYKPSLIGFIDFITYTRPSYSSISGNLILFGLQLGLIGIVVLTALTVSYVVKLIKRHD